MTVEVFEGDRRRLAPLFALADDSEAQIDAYRDLGEVLVARDGVEIIGHLQVISGAEDGEFELKSMAVAEARQGQGVGRGLVEAALARCRALGGRRMIVSTATADIGNLRFYQRLGFRMRHIVQDAFVPATGYPEDIVIDGIPLRDQVVFEQAL